MKAHQNLRESELIKDVMNARHGYNTQQIHLKRMDGIRPNMMKTEHIDWYK